AELVVLGTKFHLSGASDVTYVETDEGSVQVTRNSDGASAKVDGGFETSVGAAAGPLSAHSLPHTLRAPRWNLDGFWTAAFAPDGRWRVAGRYLAGDIELWDVESSQRRSALTGHRKRINTVAFSPDGQTL